MTKWVALVCGLHIVLACEYIVVRQPHNSADKLWTRTNLIPGKDLKTLFPNILLYITHRKGSYPKLL